MKSLHADITLETSGLIIHGVNAQRAMGSGVAKAILTRWPIVYDSYMSRKQGKEAMGQVQFVHIEEGLFVGNCWTQEFFGGGGKVYADVDSVRKCLTTAFDFCDKFGLELKSPRIASGLAGLDWDSDVLPIFEEVSEKFPNVDVTIYVWP
jgi:O-acetyl-ADP-ribose deacetylase (regulator of RNase III)